MSPKLPSTPSVPVAETSKLPHAQLEAERRYRRALEEQGGRVLHRVVDRDGNILLMVEVR